MALTLAVLGDCTAILNQLLNRNRLAYSATGGTGANQLKAYPFDAEITDALLRADGLVITECYFQSEMSLRNRFLVTSGTLADGDKIPEFTGLIGKCEYSNETTSATHTFAASAIDLASTADFITVTNTYVTGDKTRMTTSGTYPNTTTGVISANTDLYVIRNSGPSISLSRTPGGPKIVFTAKGTGTLTLTSTAAWRPSKEQATKDDVTGATQYGGYVGNNAFAGLHHISDDGFVFHSSVSFRMQYPEYVRTGALQAIQQHEPLLINWAAELLYKDHANAAFDWYRNIRKELAAAVFQGAMHLKRPQMLPADLRGN